MCFVCESVCVVFVVRGEGFDVHTCVLLCVVCVLSVFCFYFVCVFECVLYR